MGRPTCFLHPTLYPETCCLHPSSTQKYVVFIHSSNETWCLHPTLPRDMLSSPIIGPSSFQVSSVEFTISRVEWHAGCCSGPLPVMMHRNMRFGSVCATSTSLGAYFVSLMIPISTPCSSKNPATLI
jgi:hypothetical protein